jgi:hypothetical protein
VPWSEDSFVAVRLCRIALYVLNLIHLGFGRKSDFSDDAASTWAI